VLKPAAVGKQSKELLDKLEGLCRISKLMSYSQTYGKLFKKNRKYSALCRRRDNCFLSAPVFSGSQLAVRALSLRLLSPLSFLQRIQPTEFFKVRLWKGLLLSAKRIAAVIPGPSRLLIWFLILYTNTTYAFYSLSRHPLPTIVEFVGIFFITSFPPRHWGGDYFFDGFIRLALAPSFHKSLKSQKA